MCSVEKIKGAVSVTTVYTRGIIIETCFVSSDVTHM